MRCSFPKVAEIQASRSVELERWSPIHNKPDLDVTEAQSSLRRFLAGQSSPGKAVALYAASVVTLCIALYECNRRDSALPTSVSGSLLFVVLSIIPFLCLILTGWGAYLGLVRAKRVGGAVAANLSALAQIATLVTGLPLILFCALWQFPAAASVMMQAARMVRGPLWHVTSDQLLLRITGEFTPGIAQAVERSLAATPSIRMVVFDSPGGDLDEAMRIGRAIIERGLTTGVSAACSSACTYSYVAGRQRILLPGGRLGFHACRPIVWYAGCENHKYASYLVARGIDEIFVRKALGVSPQSVWYPRPDELLAAHVVTKTQVDESDRAATN